MKLKTEQENFWMGDFGDKYCERNIGEKLIASNIALFSKILSRTTNINSVIEFGANIGLNLIAIRKLLPGIESSAIEINKKAVVALEKLKEIKVYPISIFDFVPDYQRDFVFTAGLLIHINPEKLQDAYDLIYNTSKRYVCIIEYYNSSPVVIEYRGHKNMLFKRDFAGEIMDKYKDLVLIDYGFVYHGDNVFPADDATWFLLEKHKGQDKNG